MQSAGHPHSPAEADIQKLISQLRDDLTLGVRIEVADRIVQLASAEAHPQVKAALLERAGRLVQRDDPARSLGLLREAFRLYPTVSVGRRLLTLAADDPAFGRLNRLGRLADAIAAVAVGPEERVETLAEAAHVHLNLGHGLSAAQTVDALLAIAPDHPEAAEMLELAQQQILSREEALQAQRLEIAEGDEADRPDALLAYAELLLAGDEPLADAAAVVADAVDAGASLVAAAPAWVEVARAMGDPAELARALSASLVIGEGTQARLLYADELANLPGIDRAHPEAAASALRILCDALPDDPALRARLETVLASMAPDPDAELEEVRHRALKERDRVGEAYVCLTIAQRAQQRGDMELAERHFRRVRTLSPQNPESLDFFENFYRETGDHKRLLVALTQRLATAEGRDIARIALEMAHLAEGPLEAPERAIEAYQRVVAVQPDHQEATAALDRLYEQLGRWHALRDLLDRSLRALMAQIAVDDSARGQAMALLCRIAGLHEDSDKLPSHELALVAYRQVLALAPNHQVALAALTSHSERIGDAATWVDLLERAAAAAADASEVAERSEAAARVCADHLGDLPRAVRNWDRALKAWPARIEAAHGMQEACRKLQDNDGLLRALQAELAGIWGKTWFGTEAQEMPHLLGRPGSERTLALLPEIAALTEATGDAAGAIHTWRLLLEAVPGHGDALAALLRLVGSGERARWLADVLSAQADRPELTDRSRVAVLEALTALCAGPLQDLRRAAAVADRLRACEPQSDVARSVEARALVSHGDPSALRAAYAKNREGATQFVAAAVSAASGREGLGRAAMLRAAGLALRDELSDQEHAAVVLADALEAAEACTDTGAAQLALELGTELLACAEHAHLIGLQRIAADSLVKHADPEGLPAAKRTRVQVLVRGALWTEAASECAEIVEELIAARTHVDLLETLRAFEDLSERADEEAGLADRFAAWASILADDPDAASTAAEALIWLWRRSAERALRDGHDLDLARRAVDEALRAAPGERDLLGLRERIAAGQGDWTAALDTLEEVATLEAGPARAETLLRAAALCDRNTQDASRSARLYRDVLALRGDSAAGWQGLLGALRALQDTAGLVEALDAFLAVAGAARANLAEAALERLTLALDGGEVDPLAPVAQHLEAMAHSADLLDAEESLAAVVAAQLEVPERALGAAQCLLPIARRHARGEWAEQSLEILGAAQQDPAQRVTLYAELADVAQAGSPERAFSALCKAFASDPSAAERLARLEQLAAQSGGDAQLDALLMALIGQTQEADVAVVQDPALRAGLTEVRARRAVHSGDAQTAATLYTQLHEMAPGDLGPLDALEALYREAADADAIAFVLEERLAANAAQDDRLSTYLRLASVHAEERGAALEAEEVLGRAVGDFPESADAWAAWLAALRDGGDHARLVAALQRRLQLLDGDTSSDANEERHAARLEAAELLHDELGNGAAALALWVAALEVDPTDALVAARAHEALCVLAAVGLDSERQALAERLEAILEARGDWSALDSLQSARIGGAPAEQHRALLLRQAFMREHGLAQPGLAFGCLAQALSLEPADAELLAEVQRVASGKTPDHPTPQVVAEALAQAAALAPLAQTRRELRVIALSYLKGDESLLGEVRPIYDAMLSDDPSDAAALEGLEQWAGTTGDDHTRLTVLGMRATATTDTIAQATLLLEHARLAEQLGDDALALSDLHTVLQVADAERVREAAAALCELHERRGEQRELAESLMVLRGTMEDGEGRLALSLRAAQVLAASGESQRALELLQGERAEHALDADLYHAMLGLLRGGAEQAALIDHLQSGWLEVLVQPDQAEARIEAAATWLETRAALGLSAAMSWSDLTDVLDAGLRDPALEGAVAALAQTEPPVPGLSLPAARRLVALVHERGDAAAEIAARMDLLDRFEADIDGAGEREAIARQLEGSLGDADAALAHWQVLLGDSGWQEEVVAQVLRLGDALDRATEVDDVLLAAASGIEDPVLRSAARMRLVERAYGRGELARMADLLDAILSDDPGHAEAYEMRGNVLSELEQDGASSRLGSHFRHGIAHAHTDADRVHARLGLARLLHEQQDPGSEAFDLVADILSQGLSEDRDALLQLAVTYAQGKQEDLKLQTLWRIEAEHCKDAQERTRAFEALVGAAAAAQAQFDVVQLARNLATANPTDALLWQQLELAAGSERAHVVREALLEAEQACDDASLRHELLGKAGQLAESAGDIDAGITCWRMALRVQDRGEARVALRRLLTAAGRSAELAIDLEEHANVARAQDVESLLQAAELWFGAAGHPDRGLSILARLAHTWDDRADIVDRWLHRLQQLGDSRLGTELDKALRGVLAAPSDLRTRWLPERVTALRQGGSAVALYGAVHDCLDVGIGLEVVADTLVELQDRLSDLDRGAALQVLGWRLAGIDALKEPEAWCGVRLAELDLRDDDDEKRTIWVQLAHHARDVMGDAHMALDWLLHAVPLGAVDAALLQDIAGLVHDAEGAHHALAALEPVLASASALIGAHGFAFAAPVLGDDAALVPFALAAADARPMHIEAALWLESHAQGQGDTALWVERLGLRAQEQLTSEPEAALSAWLTQADLYKGSLSDLPGAAAALDHLLAIEPTHEAALRMRLDVATEGGDLEAVIRLCQSVAAHAGAEETADLYVQQAGALEMLGRLEEALQTYELVLAGAPDHPGALARRASLLARTGRKAEARAALAQAGGAIADARESQSMWLQAAELAEAAHDDAEAADQYLKAGEPARAIALLLERAHASSEALGLLTQAGEIARQSELIEDWLDGVASLVGADELPADAVEPAVALAAAAAAELGQASRAADLWQLAWDHDADSRDAREAVLALRREAGDPARLAADLERALVLGDATERAALRIELAELKQGPLAKPREALRHVLDILADQPDHAEALALAEQLALEPTCAAEAMASLEPIYRATGNGAGLERVLRKRLDQTSANGARADLARELAALQGETLAAPDAALATLIEGLGAEPRLALLEAAEQASHRAQNPAALARGYELVLASSLTAEQRFEVLTRAAAFDAQQGDTAQAERRLRALIDMRPQSNDAFDTLLALLADADRSAEQIALWGERLALLTDPESRREGLSRLVDLARAAGQTAVALTALRELARLDPQDAGPSQQVVELLREGDDPIALAEALCELGAVVASASERSTLLCEAARLNVRAGQGDKATTLYAQAFAADGTADEAFVFLEKKADHDAATLRPVYTRRVAALEPGPTRTLTLRKLSSMCAELGDSASACYALEQAVDDDPTNATVLDELLRMAELQGQWKSFTGAARRKLAGDLRRDVRVALLGQLAKLELTEALDVLAASHHIAELELIAPKEAITRHVQALLQARSGNPTEAAAGIERMLKETEDSATELTLRQQLAELYAGPLENPSKAIRELQKIIALAPQQWTARRQLCDQYAARKSPEAHAECLKQWLAALGEGSGERGDAERATLHIELAEVLLGLDQAIDALAVLSEAHALGGDTVRLHVTRSLALESQGDLSEAIAAQAWLVQHFGDQKDRTSQGAHTIRAALLWEKSGQPAKARDEFKRALDLLPGDDVATLGYGRACLAMDDTDRALRLFDSVGKKDAAGTAAELRADAFVGMGRCRMSRLQLVEARACYEKALALVPGHAGALEALAEL